MLLASAKTRFSGMARISRLASDALSTVWARDRSKNASRVLSSVKLGICRARPKPFASVVP
ncbi:hypothetical protein D3C86_2264420 [compost metagenome]